MRNARSVLAIALASAMALGACRRAPPCELAGEMPRGPAFSVQLHVHGSFSEGEGSIDSHTAEAAEVGADAIWWSDHDFRISGYRAVSSFGFDAQSEPIDRGEAWDARRFGQEDEVKRLVLDSRDAPEQTLAFESDRPDSPPASLRIAAAAAPAEEFQRFSATFSNQLRRHVRPLAAGVRVRLAIWPESNGPDARVFVEVALSLHPDPAAAPQRHALVYYLGAPGERPRREGARYLVPLAWQPDAWNRYALEVSRDAAQGFPERAAPGDDSLSGLGFGVEARRGARASARFDSLRIEQQAAGEEVYARQRELLAHFAAAVPAVGQLQGLEISYFAPHLNEFSAGTELPDYEAWLAESGLAGADGRPRDLDAFKRFVTQKSVERAHARGGLVSYNHPYGARLPGTVGPRKPLEETRDELVARRLWGADLLEVGYRERGGRSLADHLWLWDELARAGLFPVGVGVSDSHGGWNDGWRTGVNNFVSWVYAPSREKGDLIAGLAAGRAFFGDPTRFDGLVELASAGGARMGSLALSERGSECVSIWIDGLAADDRVRVVERGIETARYGAEETRLGVAHPVALDGSLPHPVRVEVHDAAGHAKVLSNPIVFLREVGPDLPVARVHREPAGTPAGAARAR
jgi:hypothetical protein